MIQLTPVYVGSHPTASSLLHLYELLRERQPHESVSHQETPTWQQHVAFVKSHPYEAWYLIEDNGIVVGATYITRHAEIGIFIYRQHQRKGYGLAAVKTVIGLHPHAQYLWNVNPANVPSIRLVNRLGGKLLQHTYVIQRRTHDDSNEVSHEAEVQS